MTVATIPKIEIITIDMNHITVKTKTIVPSIEMIDIEK